jgi:uncharacterized protein with HEPN domain
MNTDDVTRLKHMLEAAQTAIVFMAGENRASLDGDRKLVFAVVRAVEIIGEAASRVSEDVRAENPQIPWAAIVGMRNRLVHAYFDVDLDQVWSTITDDLPSLITALQEILPPDT